MAAVRPEETGGASRRVETLEELFLALEGSLLCYAMRYMKEQVAAEDLVQEAFLRLQASGESVREPRRWLYRTVHNLALNQLRGADRIIPLPGLSGPDEAGPGAGAGSELADTQPLPDEQLARWEGIGLVRLGLESLDPRSREVVKLKFEENLSYREIAERTGLSTGNVGYLLHHAIKALADELARAGLVS
jgi:RNA polymerase sigma factor (sigma-70 family)